MADRAAPMLAALLLCLMMAAGTLDTLRPVEAGAYFEEVAGSIGEIPIKVGDFVGHDGEVTPSAVQLLKPNKLLQRDYVDPWSGRGVTLLFVHCGNVRDMGGHYPPNCYPAHGWRSVADEDTTVEIAGSDVPAKLYEFSQRSGGVETQMYVLNFFVLPTHEPSIVADIGAIEAAGGSHRAARLGAAQVQLVASDPLLIRDAGVVAAFMRAIEPAVNVISKGPTSE